MKIKLLQKKLLRLGIVIIIIWFPNNNFAQSVKRQCISSFGSSVLIDSISIGQTAGQSYNTNGISENRTAILQGFQQPKTFAVEDISDPSLKNLKLSVYPNPASFSITIKSEEEIEQSIIQVVDINGKYVFSEKVSNLIIHNINCDAWGNGVYLITICDSEQNSKTLRLIISK